MKKITNLEKLLKEIDNVKNIERHTKKRESKRRERLCRIGLLIK